jgi:hypothetical protein
MESSEIDSKRQEHFQHVSWWEVAALEGAAEVPRTRWRPRGRLSDSEPAVAPVELVTRMEADRRRRELYRNVGRIGAPTGFWKFYLFFLAVMGGQIDPAPKLKGGMLGTHRPMPYQATLWIIVIVVLFTLAINGWFTIR